MAVEGGAGVELHLLHDEAGLAQEEALRDGKRPGKGGDLDIFTMSHCLIHGDHSGCALCI